MPVGNDKQAGRECAQQL